MTEQVDKPPLRIALIFDSFVQPRWVRRALERILATNIATIELVVNVDQRTDNRGGLLYKLYERVDRRLFAADALELVSVEDLLAGVKTGQGFEQIKAADLDVIVNFGPDGLNAELSGAARYGVWFYAFGAEPGFNEVMNQIPITMSSLRCLKGDEEHVIYQSASPTLSRFSVRLNNNTCYWKSAAFVARALRDLHLGVSCQSAANRVVVPAHCRETPGAVAMSQMFLKLSGRAASRGLEKLSSFEQWILAYRFNQDEFKYLMPPDEHFWADPFPIKVDGRYYIFFEDYVNSAGRAHISVIEVDRNGIVNGPTEVLKLECHLSYPFVFEHKRDYYMIPETGEKNAVELYRAVSFPFNWVKEKVLLEANQPLDATLIEVEGTWWMFVNIQEEGVAVNWDELHLYYAKNLHGPWQPHARNPIVSDVRSARPAGRLFWSNDVLFRPSQDSSMRYGYATTINKVTTLSPSAYNETEVLKILPDWDKHIIGVHTLNLVDEITVIDCLTKRSRLRNVRLSPPKGSLDLLSSANMLARL